MCTALLPTVTYQIDGAAIHTANEPGFYPFTLDTAKFTAGPHTLTLIAKDDAGHTAGSPAIPLLFGGKK